MATRMQQRRGTASEWTTANPTLAAGEIGFETDSGKFKIGDGTTAWSSLNYFKDSSDLDENFIPDTARGAADGVASLDENGQIPVSQLGNIIDAAPEALDTIAEIAAALTDANGIVQQGLDDLEAQLTTYIDSADQGILSDVNDFVTNLQLQIDEANGSIDSLDTDINTLEVSVNALTENLDTAESAIVDINTAIDGINQDISDVQQSVIDAGLDLATHEATTTNIHGILDTSVSATQDDVLGAITSATSTAAGYVSTHNSETTNVHGILDTADLVVTADLASKQDVVTGVSDTEIGYLSNVTSDIQTQIDAKSATGHTHIIADIADLQTELEGKLSLSGGTMTGKITLDGDPTQALHAASKEYVDNVASGILAKPAVYAATTANLTATYDNGTDGVGATLTATSNGAFPVVDGVQLTTSNGTRGILVKNQTNSFENGRYNLTTLGDASNPWVLTRCGLCDESDEIPGMYVFVTDGDLNEGTGWVGYVSDPTTYEVGTDSVSFFQFAGAGSVTAGTNIEVSGNQVSLVATPEVSGIEFSDGTQTKMGVPSITEISQKTSSYELSSLDERDTIIELNSSSALTFTIPTDASVNYPVGTTLDIIQTGSGQVTVAGAVGVTVNATPGLNLRTQWSACTILKRGANLWLAYGDLQA